MSDDTQNAEVGSDPPLTPLQREVVEQVAQGQDALGSELHHERVARWGTFEGRYRGGVLRSMVENVMASDDAQRVHEAEDTAMSLTADVRQQDVVPAGGPPTPEEVHEAEMHPWPHHNTAETIEHNRAIASGTVTPDQVPEVASGIGTPTGPLGPTAATPTGDDGLGLVGGATPDEALGVAGDDITLS